MTMLSYKKTPFHCLGYSQLLIFGIVLWAIIQFVDCPDPVFLLPLLSIMCFEEKEKTQFWQFGLWLAFLMGGLVGKDVESSS